MAGATFCMFEFVERISSKDAKMALTKQIKSFDVDAVASLPQVANTLFQTIFGATHFSKQCFLRSACISIVGIAFFLGIAAATPSEDYFYVDVVAVTNGWNNQPFMLSPADFFKMAIAWTPISILLDYFMLLKTRLVLHWLGNRQFRTGIFALAFLLDVVFGYYLYFFILDYVQTAIHGDFSANSLPTLREIWFFTIYAFGMLWPINAVSAFFYAGMLPSAWLWMYIASVFIARAIARSKGVLTWFQWFLDFETAPLRSIGLMAAALMFVLTLIPMGLAAIL